MLPCPSRPRLRLVRKRDPAEVAAVHVRNAVVAGQPFVDEGVVGGQQVDHALIVAKLAGDEQLGLALERLPQVVVEHRERVHVGRGGLDVSQVEPLRREVADERGRPVVGEHPLRLSPQDRGGFQLAAASRRQQLVVGDAAPQEERQPRRDLEVGQTVGALAASRSGCRVRCGTGTEDRPGGARAPPGCLASNPCRARASL